MSAISGLLGVGGGAAGTGFASAAQANIQNPATVGQATTAYDQTQSGLAQQQAFVQALQGQNGVGNQSSVFNQLQGVANGTGPNPAQAQLAQSTGANTANQAALMAGQRGSSANPALIARQAAMQGGANQQQAAGQAATMQAQQSLGAMNQLGGIAGQQVQQQAQGNQAYNQAAQGQQQNLLNSIQGQNNAAVGSQASVNAANSAGATAVMGNQAAAIGGLAKGAGSAAGMAGGGVGGGGGGAAMMLAAEGGSVPHFSDFLTQKFASGGKVQALVSPGERYLSPGAVKSVEKGANPMTSGEKIQGTPKVGGAKNSYANDTVAKKLDEGGIVLPRSVTQSKTPGKDAHKFVEAILAKDGKTLPKKAK